MSISSPNEDNGSEVSGPDSVYDIDEYSTTLLLRLTPAGKYTIDDVVIWLETIPISHYIIGQELLPKEHYHVVVMTDIYEGNDVIDQFRRDVISFLHAYWPDGQRPRGWGNAQYQLMIADDPYAGAKYALKDKGLTRYQGFDDEYIERAKSESFQKKEVSNFKIEYRDLCQKFKESDMDIKEFMVLYAQLKAKYGQQVRMHDAYGYALSNLIARNPAEAEEYVEAYLYKV